MASRTKSIPELEARLTALRAKLSGARRPKRQALLRAKVQILTGRIELARAKAA